jgi:curved DNA-binding protein CbpA
MASSNNKIKQPEEDPYDVLGLEFPVANDAVITKAYRKLALQYHPDKQKQTATEAQAAAMEVKFHKLQQARAFLLDTEFQASRQAYDRQRASQQARKQHEQVQREKLSEHRKRMREELAAAEAKAASKQRTTTKSATTTTSNSDHNKKKEQLKRQGQAMREAHAAKQRDQKVQQQRQQQADEVASRQIRLKWSRKRIRQSPSEDSIAREFGKRFGLVDHVEFIGHKGNAALVTFVQASSVPPCIEYYKSSNEMRATHVKEPSTEETAPSFNSSTATGTTTTTTSTTTTTRDYESVAEWKARRAAARAAAAMMQPGEDSNGELDENNDQTTTQASSSSSTSPAAPTAAAAFSLDFLPKFSSFTNTTGTTTSTTTTVPFWEQLKTLEEQILSPLLNKEQMQKLRESC